MALVTKKICLFSRQIEILHYNDDQTTSYILYFGFTIIFLNSIYFLINIIYLNDIH